MTPGSRTISCSQPIAAPLSAVWALLSAPGHLESCHPFCAANPTHAWPGPGSHDTLEYHNGRVVERRFAVWNEAEGYDIEVSGEDRLLALVRWRLRPRGHGTELTIVLFPYMFDGLPAILRRPWYRTAVGPLMRRYLRSVLLGVEHKVVTGEDVRRNQFGSHPWFSRSL